MSAILVIFAVLTILGWAGQAWGQAKLPRVGILSFFARNDDATWNRLWMEPFRRNLADQGWVEGKNVMFEYSSAGGDSSRFSSAADELVKLKVDVIIAEGTPALRAAFAATRTIPIVGIDLTTEPIREGYIQSYGRPGGNVTGIFLDAPEFSGKWFELLNALVPELSRVAVLWDPGPGPTHLQAVRSVAGSLNIKLQVIEAHNPVDIDRAFAVMSRRTQAVVVLPSPMLYWQSPRIAQLALKRRLPAISMAIEFAEAGGAIAFGPHTPSIVERSAGLVAEILDGADPGDVPVERPSKIQIVVNLKTAKALNIVVPQSILLRADEVIE